MQRRRGEQIFYQAFGVSSDWQNISQHYWRARSMNRKDGRSIDWRWASLIPLSADDGVYGDQNKSVKKARDDAKGKSGNFFVLGSAGSFIFIFFPFTNCLFCCFLLFILLALLHPDWLTQSSDFSTSFYRVFCISSPCAYLAQFCRNCCGIAFQRMVRWIGTRWGAGGSDWRFGSSWASFCFSMQRRTLDRGKREMGGTSVSILSVTGLIWVF